MIKDFITFLNNLQSFSTIGGQKYRPNFSDSVIDKFLERINLFIHQSIHPPPTLTLSPRTSLIQQVGVGWTVNDKTVWDENLKILVLFWLT